MLDTVCGAGMVAEIFLQKRNAKVFASDFSKEMVKELVGKRLKARLLVEDALHLCWRRAFFGLVNSRWTVDHIENYEKAIEEIARVTKRGGYVLLTEVNPPKAEDCTRDKRGNLRYKVMKIFLQSCRFPNLFGKAWHASPLDKSRDLPAFKLKVP